MYGAQIKTKILIWQELVSNTPNILAFTRIITYKIKPVMSLWYV